MFATENQIRELVLNLYQGVLFEDAWSHSLKLIGDYLRGSAIFFGTLGPDGSAMVGHGIDEGCSALLGGPLANPQSNPFIEPMMSKAVGEAHLTRAMCGDTALVQSEMYQSALRPFGHRYVVGGMLEPAGQNKRSFALTRPASSGDYTEEEALGLGLLLPHIARAAQLRDEFFGIGSQTALAFAALDEMPRGVAIMSAKLDILFANREARRVFELDEGLRERGARLLISDRSAAEKLTGGLRSLADPNLLEQRALPPLICIPRKSGGLPFTLLLRPSPIAVAASGRLERPPIMVTITDPERKTSPSPELLRQIYCMTPVEAKLACALCEIELKQAAAKLDISINTAKTHLKAIFLKVGVSRQPALVRLLTLHGAD